VLSQCSPGLCIGWTGDKASAAAAKVGCSLPKHSSPPIGFGLRGVTPAARGPVPPGAGRRPRTLRSPLAWERQVASAQRSSAHFPTRSTTLPRPYLRAYDQLAGMPPRSIVANLTGLVAPDAPDGAGWRPGERKDGRGALAADPSTRCRQAPALGAAIRITGDGRNGRAAVQRWCLISFANILPGGARTGWLASISTTAMRDGVPVATVASSPPKRSHSSTSSSASVVRGPCFAPRDRGEWCRQRRNRRSRR
jgi:hypothetical protein